MARLATSGRVRDPSRLAFVTQTTLSVDDTARVVDALKSAFPSIRPPRKDDISTRRPIGKTLSNK